MNEYFKTLGQRLRGNSKLRRVTEFTIVGLAALVLLDFILTSTQLVTSMALDNFFYYADAVIWLIFVIDYVARLRLARDKKYFVRHNIIDFISILPLGEYFLHSGFSGCCVSSTGSVRQRASRLH